MFLDKAKIHVQSGKGGNGIVAWRREKYVPHGGPAGGDGGQGGDVYIEATENLSTLLDFKYQSIFRADDGQNGKSKNQHGRSGKHVIIKVPCGTIVRDADTGYAIADLVIPGDRVLVAAGGRGGRGNARFTSSVRQAPQFCEPGEPGIEREMELELKLIADVGIIGMPNAGKSTLISVISAARPKIADYPFTTLTPNLGVVRDPNGDGIVMADIPGLIEGSHAGAGLGHEFLRHVERCRLLLHLVDLTTEEDPAVHYKMINDELVKYSKSLSKKPQILVLSKIDAVTPEDLETFKKKFQKLVSKKRSSSKKSSSAEDQSSEHDGEPRIFPISSVARMGLDDLQAEIFRRIEELPQEEEIVPVVSDTRAFDHDDSAYEVHRKGKTFYVSGGKIDRLFSVTDMRNRAAVHRTLNILKAMGVYKALEKAGASEGHVVSVAGIEFEYVPDDVD